MKGQKYTTQFTINIIITFHKMNLCPQKKQESYKILLHQNSTIDNRPTHTIIYDSTDITHHIATISK